MVAVGVGVHLLEDGGDVTEDGGVQQRWRRGAKSVYILDLRDVSSRISVVHPKRSHVALY